jgi:hypothetical protein
MYSFLFSVGLVAIIYSTQSFGSALNSYSHQFSVLTENSKHVEINPTYITKQTAYRGRFSGNHYTYEASEKIYNFVYTHGLSDNSSIRAQTSIGDRSSHHTRNLEARDYKSSGMGDLSVAYNWLQKRDTSNVLFGGELSISTQPNEVATSNRSGNFATGGHSIRPFLGYEHATTFGVVGGLISYQVFGPRTSLFKNSNGKTLDKETELGGNLLEIGSFAEYQSPTFLVGASISYGMHDSTDTKDSEGIVHYDSKSFLGTKLYGRQIIAEGLTLIPSIRYRSLLTKNIDNLEYSTGRDLALQVSFEVTL